MKLTGNKIDAFIAKPVAAIRTVLVYGPDTGLVRERSDALMRTAVTDLSDPFLVAELAAETVVRDPALLADEAAAIALTGGRRAIRVRDCGDAIAPAVKSMMQQPTGDSLVVLQAGDLGPHSALRKLCDRYGILMIADEIMTGFGRTGTMFACEQTGIVPDFMTLSKGLTGGYLPLSVTMTMYARKKIPVTR